MRKLPNRYEITPDAGTKVNFESAAVFARKIVISKKPVMLTGSHRGMKAEVEIGWLIVDQKWYPA